MDEAVATAIEQNLNLQVQRFNPQIQNALNAQLVATYTPTFTSALEVAGVDQPPASVLSGSLSQIKDRRLVLNVGVGAPTRWHGGAYQIDFNTGRYRTNNWFASFDPQLSSVLSFTYRQPLLRNLKIDGTRQQLLVFEKNKEISDVQLQQAVYDTVRKVRNAYYDLMYAIENLNAQRQSVDIAAQLLKGNQEAVEAGMMAPLDIIQVEAEVAMRQESVIPAEVAVDRAQLALRALVFKPTGTDFRALRIEPTEVIAFQPIELDVDGAIKKALGQRSDVVVARKSMEADNVKIRYFEDQVKPSMDASITYSAQAVGGDSLVRGPFSFDTLEPGPIVGKIGNGYPGVLGRMFSGDAPGWTLKLSGSYPLGRSA
ncbi:MAG: TolC family protein, partial [Pseudohongiellaceae bacterium]